MTALERYERLESLGHWRARDDDPGREVVVKFGKSTLVLEAVADIPLAHWSLPALTIRNQAGSAVTYAPDFESTESLTIDDPEMCAALGRIITARLDAPRPPRSRRPFWLAAAALAAALLIALVNLPAILGTFAPTLIAPERAELLANRMLPLIEARTGPLCETPPAKAALSKLAARIAPQDTPRIAIADLGDIPYLTLPGGAAILSRHIAETARNPDEFAGWAALAFAGDQTDAALAQVFRAARIGDGLRFLANGAFSTQTLEAAVNSLLINADTRRPLPLVEAAIALNDAGIRSGPMIAAVEREAFTTAAIDVPLSQGSDGGPMVLSDGEWVALQAVCDG